MRIDLADSDPFLEGKTTVRGELLDGHDSRRDDSRDPKAFLTELPPGVPVPPGSTSMNFITETLAKMDSASVIEVLAQMKVRRYSRPHSVFANPFCEGLCDYTPGASTSPVNSASAIWLCSAFCIVAQQHRGQCSIPTNARHHDIRRSSATSKSTSNVLCSSA